MTPSLFITVCNGFLILFNCCINVKDISIVMNVKKTISIFLPFYTKQNFEINTHAHIFILIHIHIHIQDSHASIYNNTPFSLAAPSEDLTLPRFETRSVIISPHISK